MSFFDKLKNSMGVETPEETEEVQEENEREEKKEEKKKAEQSKARKIQIKGGENEQGKPSFAKAAEDKEAWFQPEGELAVDVFQTENDIVIQSTIAGVKPEDLDLSIENDVVTITGERKNPNPEEDRSYYYQECYWGPFSRQIILPEEIDFNLAEAMMKDGIFTLRLPKLQRQKVRKIKVRG